MLLKKKTAKLCVCQLKIRISINNNRKESENVEEVDNLIKALAVHISEIISSGKEREHEVAEKAKALADLMSARATTY